MNYVDLCDSLTLSYEKGKIVVEFHYNYYRQLELILNDYQGVHYRKKGIEGLQKMLQVQKYIPDIELRCFLSNNPVDLIQKMIEESPKDEESLYRWIGQMEDGKTKQNLQEFYKKYRQILPESHKQFGEVIEKNAVRYEGVARKFVETYLGEIYQVWNFLQAEGAVR
ncbi:hypothetical protein [Acetatifactor muris]|uniref:hypothetical protein n=1 Tax=Acetatifactor muris TaxID=879566 RepID=UPI0023EFD821|nr:hypothetical protein [Acetatifactor muris]